MNIINIFYYLAVILLFGKSFGLLSRKLGLPQVAGMVVAGVVLGLLSVFHSDSNVLLKFIIKPNDEEMNVLHVFSQIGVVLILFSSGLETNLKQLKDSGLAASLIALAGVLKPMLLGTLGCLLFMGGFSSPSQEKL